jgi:D-xylose 1-dehydrogenase (NADP+, D-xylono-1,5-lactone-forming)
LSPAREQEILLAMARIGWGILGCGWIATAAIAPAIALSKSGRLVAVASRDKKIAQDKARQLGAQRSYSPYEAMLEDREVDAVYIGLPNGLHETWALRCAEAGKHVLCEKSLAMSAEVARRMASAFDARRLRLVEAFMYRHHPQWRVVREFLSSGALGEVRLARACFAGTIPRSDDHRWSKELGGGALWDLTCYGVDAARYVLGVEPTRVTAFADAHTPEGVDRSTQALLEFPGGIVASAAGSLSASQDQSFVVVGSHGTLELDRPFAPGRAPTHVTKRRGDELERVDVAGADHFLLQVEHFAGLVDDPSRPSWPAQDGTANVTACAAVERSWREGVAVAVTAPEEATRAPAHHRV